jgi:hypothetical protein
VSAHGPRAAEASPHRGGEAGAGRRLYLDNLKVVLIAAIIAMHGVLSYAGTFEVWTYTEVREVTLGPVVEAVLWVMALPFALFMIALLFLVSGLLTVPSLRRKGPGRFIGDRLLRLGAPFVLYVLVVQPVLVYALVNPLRTEPRSYWDEFVGAEGTLDSGPLWFVGVLLIFSLGYAAWVGLHRHHDAPDVRPGRVSAKGLALAAAAVAACSFVVRLVFPFGGESGFADLNLWQWPACLAVFGLGVTAAKQGWLEAVPPRLARQARSVTLPAMAAMAALVVVTGLQDRVEQLTGGWTWPAAAFVVLESVLNLFGPVWLLAVAQRHLDSPLRWVGASAQRSAYGAFILQTLVLLALAVALRPLPLPAEAKALLVAAGGVVGSFALAWLLIRRVPAARRVL